MKIKNNVKCLRLLPSFYFITLAKVFFHLLTSLPFSYFPKLRTVIGMLLLFLCFSFFTVPFFPEFVGKSKINMKCPCIHFIYLITLHSYNRDIHRNAPKSERY